MARLLARFGPLALIPGAVLLLAMAFALPAGRAPSSQREPVLVLPEPPAPQRFERALGEAFGTPGPGERTREAAHHPRVWGLNEVASGSGVEFVVHGVTPWGDPTGGQPPPRAGHAYIAADVTVRNAGLARLRAHPASFALKDGDGRHYPHLGPVGPGPRLASAPLARGERARGWVCFEVPLSAGSAILVYRHDPSAVEALRIRLW